MGLLEIVINYMQLTKAEEDLAQLALRIDSLLNHKLVMEKSRGAMADAVRAQYEEVENVLLHLQELVKRTREAVAQGKKQFMDADKFGAAKFGK